MTVVATLKGYSLGRSSDDEGKGLRESFGR